MIYQWLNDICEGIFLAELDIKKAIGERICEARKAKGLTLKELGNIAGNLKQTRLTNWEKGTRTPGPEEIKLLASALDVSAAYLMCLSDDKESLSSKGPSRLVPLLDSRQASDFKSYVQTENQNEMTMIAASLELLPSLSDNAFAFTIADESMMPEFRVNDVLIIEPDAAPSPGNYVAIKVEEKAEVIVCQYKKLSFTSSEFELMTLNDNWPNIKVDEGVNVVIVGQVVQKVRSYR